VPEGRSPLRGVDKAVFAVALTERLRGLGVSVGLANVRDFIQALAVAPPMDAGELYWIARITLVHRHEDLTAFATGFSDSVAQLSGDILALARRGHDGRAESGGGLPWVTLPPVTGTADDDPDGRPMPLRLPNRVEELADRPFEELDAAELARLGEWLRDAVKRWPARRTRRQATDPAGHRIALRPTIARARRTGWEPIALVRQSPIRRPRRVVLLCDVSQSMSAQIPAYLLLMRALADVARADAFAFATRLTRITGPQVSPADRFGGTRIASAVRDLLRRHGDAVRGAIVLIGSDGWDSDPPAELAAAMARLHRRAHRVVWLNPRAGSDGYEPRVASMAAALPYCDDMLPAGTFRHLRDALSSITSRGSTAGTARR
jgi:uncharacterized protein with von Willebrand factor type A (vWA) domain